MIAELTALSAVFSAYAEVVPFLLSLGRMVRGILRVRGGSSIAAAAAALFVYSPRTRR